MLKLVDLQKQTNNLDIHGQSYLAVSTLKELQSTELDGIHGIIVTDLSSFGSISTYVRRHRDRNVYLMPLFIQSLGPHNGADGYTDGIQYQLIAKTADSIWDRMDLLGPEYRDVDHGRDTLIRICEYMFTRETLMSPRPDRTSAIGYRYPFAESLLEKSDAALVVNMFTKAIKEELLTEKLVDRIHQCHECHGNYLNFRETCPSCGGIDIVPEDLIHHFVCAHVAPQKTFEKDGELNCPKCDRKLRHIGIDYDKPSAVYHCKTCTHQFQEPDMKAFCIDCEQLSEITELIEGRIGEYALTSKAEERLKFGWHDTKVEERQAIGSDLFDLLLNQEKKRSSSCSCLSEVRIPLEALARFNADLRGRIEKEIAGVISGYMSDADVMTRSVSTYRILWLDRSASQIEDVMDLIINNLNKLIGDSQTGEMLFEGELKPWGDERDSA